MRWPNSRATVRGSHLRSAMLHLHYLTGLLIFVLTWLRFILQTQAFVPPSEPAPPRGLQLVTLFIHIVLYAIPIALPVLGWLALSAKAAPVQLFVFDRPLAPFALDPALAKPLGGWHERIANVGYALIGIHAAAALIHHFVLRDNTFAPMLPWARQRLRQPVERSHEKTLLPRIDTHFVRLLPCARRRRKTLRAQPG